MDQAPDVMYIAEETAGQPTADQPIEQVEDELCSLAGKIAAATARFLVLLGEFDDRRGWAGDGIRSCAHWLSWRCGLSPVTAREHVRVARRLRDLPRTATAFGAGELSYSKVRAICRVATPHSEHELVHAALCAPAGHLERLVRRLSHVEVDEESETADYRPPECREARAPEPEELRVCWRWLDNGCLQISGTLRPEDGASLLAAAEASASALHERARGGAPEPEPAEPDARGDGNADVRAIRSPSSGAFSSQVMATVSAAACEHLERTEGPKVRRAAEVVVHVDADLLTRLRNSSGAGRPDVDAPSEESASSLPRAHLDDGPALTLSVIERLACDGGIRLATHGSDGRTLDLGRRRGPNAAMLGALLRRDRGCVVPGCGRTRFLHAHHVRFWARGGTTCMDNMVMLCTGHHRLVHDDLDPEQISIEALGKQQFRFRSSDGHVIPCAHAIAGDAQEVIDAYAHIADDAIIPHWYGESIDHDWFIGSYAESRIRELRGPVADSAPQGDSAESPCAA